MKTEKLWKKMGLLIFFCTRHPNIYINKGINIVSKGLFLWFQCTSMQICQCQIPTVPSEPLSDQSCGRFGWSVFIYDISDCQQTQGKQWRRFRYVCAVDRVTFFILNYMIPCSYTSPPLLPTLGEPAVQIDLERWDANTSTKELLTPSSCRKCLH